MQHAGLPRDPLFITASRPVGPGPGPRDPGFAKGPRGSVVLLTQDTPLRPIHLASSDQQQPGNEP